MVVRHRLKVNQTRKTLAESLVLLLLHPEASLNKAVGLNSQKHALCFPARCHHVFFVRVRLVKSTKLKTNCFVIDGRDILACVSAVQESKRSVDMFLFRCTELLPGARGALLTIGPRQVTIVFLFRLCRNIGVKKAVSLSVKAHNTSL